MPARPVVVVVLTVVSALALYAFRSIDPPRSEGIFPTDPPTPYTRFLPRGEPRGTMLLVHGLHANRGLAQSSARAFADGGFEVYAIDLPGHGDSAAPFRFDDGVRVVVSALGSLGAGTILAGHSLGGAIGARAAQIVEVETLVLFSPAPIALNGLDVDRLLVVTGEFDLPAINGRARRLIDLAGARASWWMYPGVGHSGALFRPRPLASVVRWLGGDPDAVLAARRHLFLGLSFAGLAFAGAAALAVVGCSRRRQAGAVRDTRRALLPNVVAEYIAATAIGVSVLYFVSPFSGLRIYALDHVLGVVFVAGIVLWRGRKVNITARGTGSALAAGAFVIGILIVMLGSELTDTTPKVSDWWKVFVVALAVAPIAVRDELELRRPGWGWFPALAFIATRLVLGAALLVSVQLWNPESTFLVLGTHFIVVFWIVLWGITGLVRRWTDEAGATAVFSAIVQGWLLTAISVAV